MAKAESRKSAPLTAKAIVDFVLAQSGGAAAFPGWSRELLERYVAHLAELHCLLVLTHPEGGIMGVLAWETVPDGADADTIRDLTWLKERPKSRSIYIAGLVTVSGAGLADLWYAFKARVPHYGTCEFVAERGGRLRRYRHSFARHMEASKQRCEVAHE